MPKDNTTGVFGALQTLQHVQRGKATQTNGIQQPMKYAPLVKGMSCIFPEKSSLVSTSSPTRPHAFLRASIQLPFHLCII